MLRTILAAIGCIELLAPEKLIDRAEKLALENPDECNLKSWVVPVARGEGLFFVLLAWRGDASYDAFKKFLGVIGVLALLYPRLSVDYAADIAYTDSQQCKWKSWCYPLTRLVGFLYVCIALNELRKR